MSVQVCERAFEDAIERALLAHGPDAYPGEASGTSEALPPTWGDTPSGGYRRRQPDEYDRALCLLPRDVLDFVLATQPGEWRAIRRAA